MRHALSGLLSLLGRCSSGHVPLHERRSQLLLELSQIFRADAQYWAWGRGHPARAPVTPIAIIHQGFTPELLGSWVDLSMDPRAKRWAQDPFLAELERTHQTVLDVRGHWGDAVWEGCDFYRDKWVPLGIVDQIAVVRYCAGDTWSQLLFLRRHDAAPFAADDKNFLAAVASAIPWVDPCTEEVVPPERFLNLSGRQKGVMLLMLNGLSRKQIAEALFISEHTVGDHIKAIYQQFKVQSVSQLAALFLQQA
jgi:DNA-binding CsgD family transcriptional regulator